MPISSASCPILRAHCSAAHSRGSRFCNSLSSTGGGAKAGQIAKLSHSCVTGLLVKALRRKRAANRISVAL